MILEQLQPDHRTCLVTAFACAARVPVQILIDIIAAPRERLLKYGHHPMEIKLSLRHCAQVTEYCAAYWMGSGQEMILCDGLGDSRVLFEYVRQDGLDIVYAFNSSRMRDRHAVVWAADRMAFFDPATGLYSGNIEEPPEVFWTVERRSSWRHVKSTVSEVDSERFEALPKALRARTNSGLSGSGKAGGS